MAEVASAYVTLLPSARGFGAATQRQLAPQMNRTGTVVGAGFGRSLLKGFLLVGVVTKISGFVSDAFDEAREAQKVGAQVNNVIKTTGGVANITAAQVDRLSQSLSKKTGVDDEQIARAQAMLLTFKNVRREGAGLNNVFARGTRAALDLAATGFTSLEGATKMVGKALNLPEKGLTALTRAGVQFTDKQTERIKGLIEEGKQLRTQKILLREIESQVGGTAAATATWGERSRVAFDNIKESIGTALLPALDAAGRLFVTRIAPAIEGFITGLQTGQGSAGRFGAAIREGLVPWIERGRKAFDSIRKAVKDNEPELRQLLAVFRQVANFVITKLIPAQLKAASYAIPVLTAAIRVLINVATFWVNAFNAARRVVNAVETAIVKAAVGLQRARQKIVAAFDGLPGKMAVIGVQIIAGLVNGIRSAAGAVNAAVQSIVNSIPAKIREIMGIASPSKVTHILGLAITDGLVSGLESGEKKVIAKVAEVIGKVRSKLADARSGFASLADPIKSAFTGDLFSGDTAAQFMSNLLGTKGQLSGLISAFKTLIGAGLSPKFLYGLFQSGNAGLILDLARNPDLAKQAGSVFGEINQLSDQLGTAVAGATPQGKSLLNQIGRLEKAQDRTNKLLADLPPKIAQALNGPAGNARRRARAA